jgi:hypothetical protein
LGFPLPAPKIGLPFRCHQFSSFACPSNTPAPARSNTQQILTRPSTKNRESGKAQSRLNFYTLDTIYAAEPWGKESKTLVTHEPETGCVPEEAQAQGMKYFIEIFVARELLEDWKPTPDKEPTRDKICERLICYAICDA